MPLICNWLGTIPENTIKEDLIDASDFLPTMTEAAKISLDQEYIVDGKSFFPQITGQDGNSRDWIY